MLIRILDEEGEPIPGAKLYANALRPAGYDGKRSSRQDVVADASGQIALSIPRRVVLLRLWPQATGYVSEFMNYDLGLHREGELIPDELTFRLAKGAPIGGTVIDEHGQPVAGVKVRVQADIDDPAWSATTEPMISTWLTDSFNQPSVTTDSDGRWALTNAPPAVEGEDRYALRLKLHHPDYISDEQWGDSQRAQGVVTADLRRGDATLTLRRGKPVTGLVTDAQGNPVSEGWVVWHDEPYSNDGVFEAELAEDGTFATPPLPEGEHPITIVAPGFAAQRRVVRVGTDSTDLRFKLEPGKRIEVRFVDAAGSPIPNAGVYLANSSLSDTWNGSNALHNHRHPNVPDYGIPRRADDDGVFVWEWAPEGPVTYTFGAAGFAGQDVALVAKNEPHTITLAEARVAFGRVTDAQTGAPLAEFQVMPVIVFRPDFFHTRYSDTKLGAEGEYELPLTGAADPNDRYRVRFEADGYRSFVSAESYGPSDGRVELNARLAPAPAREGRVVGPDGNAVAGATVLEGTPTWVPDTYNGVPQSYGQRIIRTNRDGRFQLNATKEPVRVRVIHDQGIVEKLLAPSDTEVGELVLEPWASISGRLLQDGKPIGGQSIYFNQLVRRGLVEARLQDSYSANTGLDGAFTLKRVPPGAGSLRVALGPWRDSPLTSARSLPVTLQPGEKRDVVLGEQGAVITGTVVATGRDEAPLDRNWSLNYLVRQESPDAFDLPPGFPELGFDPTGPAQAAWQLDPHFGDWVATRENHFVKLTPEGALRVTGVVPGDYDLFIRLYEQPSGCLVETVGEKVVPVTIRPSGDVDLGRIEVPCRAGPRPGSDMRAFGFLDATGRRRQIDDMEGRHVVMHVWASWCAPCLAAMPELKASADRFNVEDVVFVGLNIDGDRERARSLAGERGWSWAQNYVGEDADIVRQLAVSSAPAYYLVGPDGRLVLASSSWGDVDQALTEELAP